MVDLAIHKRHLLRAVELSRQHMLSGRGGPFGAIIVRDGAILAEGWNEVTSSHDPTAHAEVVAIRRACAALGDFSLRGATLYTSCEPCPMCLGAAYWARIDALYFANTRHQAASIGFDDALFHQEMAKAAPGRSMKSIHMPMAEAGDVFNEWLLKADRVDY